MSREPVTVLIYHRDKLLEVNSRLIILLQFIYVYKLLPNNLILLFPLRSLILPFLFLKVLPVSHFTLIILSPFTGLGFQKKKVCGYPFTMIWYGIMLYAAFNDQGNRAISVHCTEYFSHTAGLTAASRMSHARR
jgi:hypothetical protein